MLLLESVALNLNALKGLPLIPVVDDLTVKLVLVTETWVGALGVPGGDPVVIEVPRLVVLPNVLNKVVVTEYTLEEAKPPIVAL